jgi:hypothetical protein
MKAAGGCQVLFVLWMTGTCHISVYSVALVCHFGCLVVSVYSGAALHSRLVVVPHSYPFYLSVPSLSLLFSPSLLSRPHTIMTRLMSDICHFGLADCIPDPAILDHLVMKTASTCSIISCRPASGLTSLPDDVLLLVISLIGIEDILALRMVCAHDLDSTQPIPDL